MQATLVTVFALLPPPQSTPLPQAPLSSTHQHPPWGVGTSILVVRRGMAVRQVPVVVLISITRPTGRFQARALEEVEPGFQLSYQDTRNTTCIECLPREGVEECEVAASRSVPEANFLHPQNMMTTVPVEINGVSSHNSPAGTSSRQVDMRCKWANIMVEMEMSLRASIITPLNRHNNSTIAAQSNRMTSGTTCFQRRWAMENRNICSEIATVTVNATPRYRSTTSSPDTEEKDRGRVAPTTWLMTMQAQE